MRIIITLTMFGYHLSAPTHLGMHFKLSVCTHCPNLMVNSHYVMFLHGNVKTNFLIVLKPMVMVLEEILGTPTIPRLRRGHFGTGKKILT